MSVGHEEPSVQKVWVAHCGDRESVGSQEDRRQREKVVYRAQSVSGEEETGSTRSSYSSLPSQSCLMTWHHTQSLLGRQGREQCSEKFTTMQPMVVGKLL